MLVRLQVDEIGEVQVLVRRFEFLSVVDRNCVAVRRGGEHRKTNGRSETQVPLLIFPVIRRHVAASLLAIGEA